MLGLMRKSHGYKLYLRKTFTKDHMAEQHFMQEKSIWLEGKLDPPTANVKESESMLLYLTPLNRSSTDFS